MNPSHRACARLICCAALFLLAAGARAADATPGPPAAAPAGSAAAPAEAAGNAQWDAYAAEYLEWHFSVDPPNAVGQGRHEFDGMLPDWRALRIQAVIDRLHLERARAAQFGDQRLDARRQLERDVLLTHIDGQLFWMETARAPFRNPSYYASALDPDVYLTRDYAPLPQRMRAYIAYLRAVPQALKHVRENLRAPMPRSFVQLAHLQFGGYAEYYEKEVPRIFEGVADPKLQADFRAANAAAVQAMREIDAWFRGLEASATDEFALGQEKFEQMLWATERVRVPPSRLKEIAQADLDRNTKALAEACASYAPGRPVAECVARYSADKPTVPMLEEARRQLEELRSFVQSHQVVTIPGGETASVHEAPEYQRWNAAYISIPGPYERGLPSVFYISPPDPAWSKDEQLAYIPSKDDLLFVSVHEVWPGHFLQFLYLNRAPSPLSRVLTSYAFTEGWAHYSEEMMWEEGLRSGDAEAHVGQIVNALLRNVRLLSAIGLHTGGMTVAQSEAMFRDKAFQDAGNARQQAARGTFDPAYGNYTLGKLMIRKLRDEWCAARGGREAWKSFHDTLLGLGAPPLPLARKAMLGDDKQPVL